MDKREKGAARIGRPPLAAGEGREAMLRVRLTDPELEKIRAEARRLEMSVSEWVRWTCAETIRG